MPASRSDAARTLRDVAAGGAAGALLRTLALVGVIVAGRGELLAVVPLNLLGAYLLGRLLRLAAADPRWHGRLPLLATGLLGSLTTFSGLVVPLAVLSGAGSWAAALVIALASLTGGVFAVRVGLRHGGP